MEKYKWIPVTDDVDPQHKFKWAMSDLIQNRERPMCPICSEDLIRHFSHRFEVSKDADLNRTSIWGWCNNCGHWSHNSGVSVASDNVLTDAEFEKIDNYRIIETLNNYWECGKIPHEF